MYVNGAVLDAVKGVVDRVYIEECPLDLDYIMVGIKDADYDAVASRTYALDSLEAVIVTLGAGEDHFDNSTSVRDIVYGGDGDDILIGGAGDDYLESGMGTSWLFGTPGNDTIYGGPDGDMLLGQDGNDIMYGDDGDDYMVGGPGTDTLRGGNNNDTLFGNSGVDTLYGNAGNDSLIGGPGSFDGAPDTLWGNAGADKFKRAYKPGFNPLVWEDILADFNAGQGDTTIP